MVVFINPTTQQVMALYSHDTTSTVWTAQGFSRVVLDDPEIIAEVSRHGRDCALQFSGSTVTGVIARPNPVQPQPKPDTPEQARLKALNAKLQADTITDAEVRELLRLERGLSVASVRL